MATVHMIVGTLVLLGYLALTIAYFRGSQGHELAQTKMLSQIAGAVIVVQWALGFIVLATSDDRPNAIHYVFALATILTVGAEHAMARPEPDPIKRNRLGMYAAAGTFVLALIAYAIGESTS